MNYYNDNDPNAAAWLRELIKRKLIPAGDVDERSIKDVTGSDLKGYTQCHFFAGIGGWSEALRLAGWGTDIPVWTGSCPCQPFSCAGKGEGEKDPRHLWPEFYRLIRECKPNVVFGEQVERAIKMGWIDRVFADLETEGYTCGAAVLGAHSAGAPHVRQRIFWVGNSNCNIDYRKNRSFQRKSNTSIAERTTEEIIKTWNGRESELVASGVLVRISSYSEALRILDGIPGRMELIRGYGNAIVPQVAAEFVRAYMEVRNDHHQTG
jgi:DNA (cytosine-5)-methyltransferase 1